MYPAGYEHAIDLYGCFKSRLTSAILYKYCVLTWSYKFTLFYRTVTLPYSDYFVVTEYSSHETSSIRDLKTQCNTYVIPSPHLEISYNAIGDIMRDACSIVSGNTTCDFKTILPRVTELTKSGIKDIHLKRYRVIVTSHVIDGHIFQGKYLSGFLWDERMDRCIEYRHKTFNGFLICVAYLIYME